jgi:hypothetical protein
MPRLSRVGNVSLVLCDGGEESERKFGCSQGLAKQIGGLVALQL